MEGRELVVPASIGVAAIGSGEAVAVDELLRRADVAMYHAKAQGKNRLAGYNPAIDVIPGSTPVAATAPAQPRHSRTPSRRPATST